MTLEKFLEGRPELVKKIEGCTSEEEIMRAIEEGVSAEELATLEIPEIPNLQKMDAEDIANISGGAWQDTALEYGSKALVGIGKFFNGPINQFGGYLLEKISGNNTATTVTGTLAVLGAGYSVVKAFQGANAIRSKMKKK